MVTKADAPTTAHKKTKADKKKRGKLTQIGKLYKRADRLFRGITVIRSAVVGWQAPDQPKAVNAALENASSTCDEIIASAAHVCGLLTGLMEAGYNPPPPPRPPKFKTGDKVKLRARDAAKYLASGLYSLDDVGDLVIHVVGRGQAICRQERASGREILIRSLRHLESRQ